MMMRKIIEANIQQIAGELLHTCIPGLTESQNVAIGGILFGVCFQRKFCRRRKLLLQFAVVETVRERHLLLMKS